MIVLPLFYCKTKVRTSLVRRDTGFQVYFTSCITGNLRDVAPAPRGKGSTAAHINDGDYTVLNTV